MADLPRTTRDATDSGSLDLRVCVIEPSGRLYGSEYCLLDIIVGLSESPIDWTVILPQGLGLDQCLVSRGISVRYLLPQNSRTLSRFRKFLAYVRILMAIRKMSPDILYVNQTGALRAAAIYSRLLKIPIVCQVQTLEDARWLSTQPKLHECVCAFICNSQYIADRTLVARQKKCVLYQGLPATRSENASRYAVTRRHRELSGEFTIGVLGRIAVSKGHYLLLSAAKEIVKNISACRFIVIGDGLTEQDTEDFHQAVINSGLSDYFEFRGYRADLPKELARIDLLAIPSIAEPLGRVLFDAAEFGVPVVLSDAGGLGEIARHFDIGISFRSNDVDNLAEAVIGIQQNYYDIAERFSDSAKTLFERLPMGEYLTTVQQIIQNAAKNKPSALKWFGT